MKFNVRDEINGYTIEGIQTNSTGITYTLRAIEPVVFEQIHPFTKIPYQKEDIYL